MSQVQNGDTVQVHYTGKLQDGTVFDSSRDREPLEFKVGEQTVIPGFENAVVGMEVGETKTAQVPADDAYGQRREDMIFSVDNEQIPEDLNPKVGDQLRVQLTNGESALVLVHAINQDGIELDANHPLAGHDLEFDIELVSVE